jgi:hypothetical protein
MNEQQRKDAAKARRKRRVAYRKVLVERKLGAAKAVLLKMKTELRAKEAEIVRLKDLLGEKADDSTEA